jgi:uncharacterized spore protein YtfJ
VTSLALGAVASGQAQERRAPAADPGKAASDVADALARRAGETLRVKTVVGKPVEVGSVSLIPILMVDLDFGGADLVLPASPPEGGAKAPGSSAKAPASPATASATSAGASPAPAPAPPAPIGADGFIVSGEARPLGFVVVTKQGTRFISVAPTSAE